MYEYRKGNYVYYGSKEYGSPMREVKTISQAEANYWDRLEKRINQQRKNLK